MKKRQMLTFVWATMFLSLTVLMLDIPLAGTVEWQTEIQLTTNSTLDMSPSIMQAENGTIWVVWVSNRMGFGNDELFYKTSSNYGLTWSTERRLTVAPGYDEGPSMMQASNGTIWVVWASYRTGNYELFYKTFNGSSWSSDAQFAEESHQDMRPYIMQSSDGLIWVVWYSDRTGNYELFYKTYNGSCWSPEAQLTSHPSADVYPSIAQASNGTIWVVWASYRTGNYELFYKIFDGVAWSSDIQLTNDPHSDSVPSIVRARDGAIWVVWQSGRPSDDQDELYYKIYNGSAWTSDAQLTSDLANDMAPSIAQMKDKRIWVVWQADRDDDFDLYYKISNEIINCDVAITSVTPSPGKVNQGEIVSISVVAENQGDIDETFKADCYANKTKIGSTIITLANKTSTELTFSWNTTGVGKGRYVLRAEASIVPYEIDTSDNAYSHTAVVVTTLGDINGDLTVNIDDLIALNQSYGSTSTGGSNWNPNADLNKDSITDVADLLLLSKNYT
jgi:hypothetical protein